jgi:hypothetical protein
MSRVSIYDAMMWLRKIRKAGFNTFTTSDIKGIVEYNHGYLLALINNNLITSTKKVRTGLSTNTVNVWQINDVVIKKHMYRKAFYQD